MRWPWQPEDRALQRADVTIAELLRQAQGTKSDPNAIAAIEAASGIMGRALASAIVEGDRFGLVTPRVLELVGRSLIRRGEAVFGIQPGPRLAPCSTWTIRGADDPAAWTYRLDFPGPSSPRSAFLPSAAVVHIRVNTDLKTPWRGRAPHQLASSTAKTAADAEMAIQGELEIPVARILPTSTTEEQRRQIAESLKFGGIFLSPGGGGPVTDRQQDRAQDWKPQRMGPEPDQQHVELRTQAAQDMLAACGIPPSLFSGDSDSGKKEAYRQFVASTVSPLARLALEELRDKLDSPDLQLTFSRLRAHDTQGAARSTKALTDAGLGINEALSIVMLVEAAS